MKGKGKKSTKKGPPQSPCVVLPMPDFAANEAKEAWTMRAQAEFNSCVASYVEDVRAWQSANAPAADSDGEFEPGGGSSGGGGGTGGW